MQKALASAPREWTGRIQRSRLFEAARLVLPIEFPETGEDLEDMAPESAALYEIVKTTSEGDGFSASAFAVELQKLSEEWYRRLALQRREIQRQMNLDEETFASAGTELPHLDEIFRRVSEGKGYLDRNEAEKLFDELGVVPHSLMQKRKTLGFFERTATLRLCILREVGGSNSNVDLEPRGSTVILHVFAYGCGEFQVGPCGHASGHAAPQDGYLSKVPRRC